MKITFHNSQNDFSFSLPQVRKRVGFLLKELNVATDEVIFHFVSEKKISEIHKKFFNDPSVTDCITFPIDPYPRKNSSYHLLGEAFICPKTAIEQARRHRVRPAEELHRYLIHCLLHMIGYDDIDPKERARMKRKERACLKKLFPTN